MAVRKSKTAQRRERVSSSTQQRTIVLPLPLTREQYDPIRRSAEEYNRMWSSLISWCDSNKTVNRTRIQKENYRRLRDRHPTLPAQFACIAMRDAAGAMRSWNSNHPKRRWNMKASRKALTINYDMRVMSLRGNLLTLSVAHGEKRVRLLLPDLPEWFTARYPEGKPNAAKLLLGDKPEDTRIALIYRISDPQPLADGDVLGVDLGQHSLYMDSRGGEAPYARVQGAKRRYAHNRKTLQEKGTCSAHRRLKAMKQREERFIRDVNHQASKRLVNTQGVQAIAFEDLTYIRRQASKRTKTGARRRNMLNQWSFSASCRSSPHTKRHATAYASSWLIQAIPANAATAADTWTPATGTAQDSTAAAADGRTTPTTTPQ